MHLQMRIATHFIQCVLCYNYNDTSRQYFGWQVGHIGCQDAPSNKKFCIFPSSRCQVKSLTTSYCREGSGRLEHEKSAPVYTVPLAIEAYDLRIEQLYFISK